MPRDGRSFLWDARLAAERIDAFVAGEASSTLGRGESGTGLDDHRHRRRQDVGAVPHQIRSV